MTNSSIIFTPSQLTNPPEMFTCSSTLFSNGNWKIEPKRSKSVVAFLNDPLIGFGFKKVRNDFVSVRKNGFLILCVSAVCCVANLVCSMPTVLLLKIFFNYELIFEVMGWWPYVLQRGLLLLYQLSCWSWLAMWLKLNFCYFRLTFSILRGLVLNILFADFQVGALFLVMLFISKHFQWLSSCQREKLMTTCVRFIVYCLGREQR